MSGRGSGRMAARLLCAAASAAIAARAPRRRADRPPPPPPEPAELDPNAPLAPMPDLGVDWPDLEAARRAGAAPTRNASSSAAPAPRPTANIRYAFAIEGIGCVGDATELLAAFRAAVGAGSRPQAPRQRRADRPPLAR